ALRHVWQTAGARLAGHLGLVTLAEARDVMRGASEHALIAFVASRIADARARQTVRRSVAVAPPASEAIGAPVRAAVMHARPLPDTGAPAPRIQALAPGAPSRAFVGALLARERP